MTQKFKGVFTALVTPFENGKVDYTSLEKLVQYQIDNKVNGFVINGTTAESPTLTPEETQMIYSVVRAIVGIEFPLILGTGSNSTAKTIQSTQKAEELGADAALVVVPYYNKPPQRGLVQHFKSIATETSLPIILYNVPGRTITNLSVDSIVELSNQKNIVGLKEASGDLQFDKDIVSNVNKDFILLSGDDGTYLDFLKLGGHGIISVMSNLLAKECVRWTTQALRGDVAIAEKDFAQYKTAIQSMYVEANPIPIKWMLYKKGIIKSPELRLPLSELDKKYYHELELTLKNINYL